MNNGEPIHSLDIQQLKWALRAGKIDVWGGAPPVEKESGVVADNAKNTTENPPICATVLEQISEMEKQVNQQIALFRNEFAVFIQAQVNQEKALRLSETEWQKKLVEHESKMLAEMWEMRQSIIGEFTTYFQLIAEQLQTRDQLIHKEVSLLKEQLTEMHQYQEYHKEQDLELAKEWNQKIEDCQIQLIDCMQHIQKVLEEINSSDVEKQKQEDFFLREIAIVKSEVANLRQTYQSKEGKPIIVDMEPCNPIIAEENEETRVEVQQVEEVEQYRIAKKKRRHRRG
jgi:hypothetical protein